MALPHGESAALARQLPDARIIDLSADFRLGDEAAWDAFYGDPYAGQWTYGLPELPGAREKIASSRTVAAPGCYATTSILALAPLLAHGLAEPDDIVIVAASGTSGAGRAPRPDLLASEVMGSMSAYKVGGTHRHTPEIEQALTGVIRGIEPRSARYRDHLVHPHAGPDAPRHPRHLHRAAGPGRGRQRHAPGGASATSTRPARSSTCCPAGQWPATRRVSGSNGAHLQVAADTHAGRAVVVATTDNLGKGAAGQAVQIANIMLGLPETAGLTSHGVAP